MQQILGEQLSFQNILNPIAQEGLKVAELDLSMNRESIKYVKGSEAGKEHLNNALSKLEALTLRWAWGWKYLLDGILLFSCLKVVLDVSLFMIEISTIVYQMMSGK